MILVTGAAGFIGSHLVRALVNRGYKVRAVDCFLKESYNPKIKFEAWSELEKLKNIELIELDLRNEIPEKILSNVEVVINLAAMPGLARSWTNFDVYVSCNTIAVFNLLQSIKKSGNKTKFIQISTSSVYGKLAIGNELMTPAPISPYGLTKLTAEELVQMSHRNEDIQFMILRYFSVYGPNQRPDMAYHRIIDALLNNQPINIYGDGTQSRTNTFISDCVEGTILALEGSSSNQIVNISGSNSTTLLEAITSIEENLGKKAFIKWSSAQPGDQLITQGDITKAKKILKFEPKVGFSEGISEQIIWQKTQL